jgi:hypothetical protein
MELVGFALASMETAMRTIGDQLEVLEQTQP